MTAFDEYLKHGRKGHLIGIGGVSMAPLAEVLAGTGLVITGSDMNHSDKTAHLEEMGVRVYYGHRPENIERTPSSWSAPPPSMTRTRRSSGPMSWASPCMSALRTGVPS